MRAYRSFFLFSLCTHVLLLAFTEATLLPSWPRPQHTLKVTLLQKAVPLPLGEPATGTPAAGKPPATPSPEPAVRTPSLPPPKPKPRKKPSPPSPPPVTQQPPLVEPPPPAQTPLPPTTTASIGLHAGDTNHSAAEQTDSSVGNTRGGGENGGHGSKEGRGAGGTGTGRGGGGSLARPDYGINPKPPYPLMARRLGAQGIVVLRVLVQENGTVGEVTVSQSSGFSILDESALKTVRERWRFVPARLDGRPVASWVEVPIRFVLTGS